MSNPVNLINVAVDGGNSSNLNSLANAQSAVLAFMNLELQLNEQMTQLQRQMYQANNNMATSEASAAISSANAASSALLSSAIGQFASAGLQGGMLGVEIGSSRSLSNQNSVLNDEINKAKAYQSAIDERLTTPEGTVNRVGTDLDAPQLTAEEQLIRENRENLLNRHVFSDEEITGGQKAALSRLNNDEAETVRKRVASEIKSKETRYKNNLQLMASKSQQLQMVSNSLSTAATASGQTAQSTYQAQQGKQEAARLLYQNLVQQTNGIISQYQQQGNSAVQGANGAVQELVSLAQLSRPIQA